MSETYKVPEAAELLGVNKLTLYTAIKEGTTNLPVVRVGRRMLIPKAALHRMLDGLPPIPPTDTDSNETQGGK